MENPIKRGKLANYKNRCCTICGKVGCNNYYRDWETLWLCKECVCKMKYKPKDVIWFLKFNKDLEKLEVICGTIECYSYNRTNTYTVEYHTSDGPFKRCEIYEDYIFNTKEECILYGNKLGEVASDLQIQDLNLMKKQSKLYKQISDFLKSSEAIQFGVRGIDVRVENGYVNAEWKFGKRDVGDIKDIIL